jgi:hypothetical protein
MFVNGELKQLNFAAFNTKDDETTNVPWKGLTHLVGKLK